MRNATQASEGRALPRQKSLCREPALRQRPAQAQRHQSSYPVSAVPWRPHAQKHVTSPRAPLSGVTRTHVGDVLMMSLFGARAVSPAEF